MTENIRRNDSGQFESTLNDDQFIEVLATADHPLSTSEVADRVGRPRTTAWDHLRPLEAQGRVESWQTHERMRMWTVPGSFGDTSAREAYTDTPLVHYLETGEFPADTDIDMVLGQLDELLAELNWNMPMGGGPKFEEMRRLADLFDLSVSEIMQESPAAIYARMHAGEIYFLPGVDDDPVPDEEWLNGDEFRAARQEAGVSQRDVAIRVDGVTQPDVSMFERGESNFDSDTGRELWAVLDELKQDS